MPCRITPPWRKHEAMVEADTSVPMRERDVRETRATKLNMGSEPKYSGSYISSKHGNSMSSGKIKHANCKKLNGWDWSVQTQLETRRYLAWF